MNDNRDHLRALLAAYNEATGMELSLSHGRMETLRECDRRGIGPADIAAVLGVLKGRVARGVAGYTDSSLLFDKAIGVGRNVDRLENRIQQIAAMARRRKPGAAAVAPAAAPMQDAEETARLLAQGRDAMAKWREEHGR